jgi:hypothetical protein
VLELCRLVGLDVLEPVHDPTADLQEGRTLLCQRQRSSVRVLRLQRLAGSF